jgi:2-phosphosulfolactate phosphatase
MVVNVNVEFAARDARSAAERGDLIVVIDVLRCCTSIIKALANGARSVIPARTLREAYGLHDKHPEYLLAGERKGLKPKGFDLGNSPQDFTRRLISGKNLVMTTTSGTFALVRSKPARWIFVAALLNSRSVSVKALRIAENEGRNVSLVLSGEEGRFSLEDFICAGAVAARFPRSKVSLFDEAWAAVMAFEQSKSDLYETISKTRHGRHLVRLGLSRDVEFSCQLDVLNVTPICREGKITRLE